jgi:FtsH-binding integral membrane protein
VDIRRTLVERSGIIPAMSTPEQVLPGATTRDRALSVFGEVMGLVAITCLFAAAGAYIGKGLTGLWWLLPWLLAIGCIFGLNIANAKGNRSLALVLLFGLGLLLGISVGTTIAYYASTDPTAVYQATAATGLFVAALGTGGYAIRKDLSGLYRVAFFLLLGLIVFGIVAIFVNIPAASMIYSVLGLGIFGLYVVLDFNRLRRAGQEQAIPLAAGIFLDVFNIFLFFLRIFGGSR